MLGLTGAPGAALATDEASGPYAQALAEIASDGSTVMANGVTRVTHNPLIPAASFPAASCLPGPGRAWQSVS
ncbi:hypothetical protein [Acrocarpospora corrugata]|uniref:hypothetical protein n=1 Tax=Acrocarpospora corrugata TaxID=35763 RepID=UPI0031D76F96